MFAILAGLLATLCVVGRVWWLLWPAGSFLILAAGYATAGPGVFGKRPNGTLRPANVLALFPLLLLLWAIWHLQRLLSREPAWHEVTPGLLLGRRVLPGELPGVGRVIDLSSEFAEPRGVRSHPGYRCLPTLDASAPSDAGRFAELVDEVVGFAGRVYVHCANGHGRSAVFVAAVLAARGMELKDALRAVRAARPGVRPNRVQLSWLRKELDLRRV